MVSSIRLSNLFQSVANSDYPYIHNQYSINSGNRVKTLVLPENVEETELYQFNMFLSAIEIKPTDINNMGFAYYSNDVFNYHSPCYLGLRDGQLGLLIGTTTDRFNIETQDLFIPCEVDQVEKKRGKKTVTEFEYTINGTPIELIEQVDNEGKGTGKFYINLEYVEDLKTINFSFPFLVDKKANYQPSDIIKFWRSGKFADVCRDVNQRNSRLWIECNKAFVPSFQSKSFPRGGILLLVKNGAIKITPAGTYENIKSDIVQSSWEIIASSHPELIINWKNSNKEYEYITLADATDIQFTSAMVKNEGYTWLVNNTYFDNQIMLIHIVEPSAIKITNSPVNTVTALEPRILAKIATFPHLQEIYRAIKDKMQSKQLPASAQETIREATKEDYEDVNGVYPVLAGSGLEDF
jgi:hypothetical protein